eukprot:76153_1
MSSSTTKRAHADEYLITGYIREVEMEWYVAMDIVRLLSLFCTIGDNFEEERTNKNITITYNDSDDNEYGSKYQTLATFADLTKLMSEYTDPFHNTHSSIFHAFGARQVSRVKYIWNVSVHTGTNAYVGVVDNQYVKAIYNNENKFIPELTHADYFFSAKYHGYGLSLMTGDVYHNNSKYGKPYILNHIHAKQKPKGNPWIITIELDLTGKIYGKLRFIVRKLNLYGKHKHHRKTRYFNDMCFAYDDILVHKKYQLVVAMGSMVTLLLFDDLFATMP